MARAERGFQMALGIGLRRLPGRVSRSGFTLTELLVVIGIAIVLLAIMLPTGQSLREGNRALTCKSQLMQIGRALGAYQLDEWGAPPFYINPDEDPDTDSPHGPGLMTLRNLGYLNRREALHCPRDTYADSNSYFESYQREDEDVDTSSGSPLDAWPYLNTRGIFDDADPFYRRQIQPAIFPVNPSDTAPSAVVDPTWRPADGTVVTWCPFHTEYLKQGGVGLYQVLFWDGSVVRIPEDIMTDPSVGPGAPWKVSQSDGIE